MTNLQAERRPKSRDLVRPKTLTAMFSGRQGSLTTGAREIGWMTDLPWQMSVYTQMIDFFFDHSACLQ